MLLLVVAVLVAGSFPAGVRAQQGPSIQLLNPSAYSTPPELSTKLDTDAEYHFVAVVPQVPSDPFVEFEIEPTAGNRITLEATRVGADTWESTHNLAGLTDGQYTIHAILYSGGQQFGTSDSQVVTINNADLPPPPQAETAEITHPDNGDQLGFFTPPGGSPRAIVDVATSENAQQVRVLYSTAGLGAEPEWVQCGTGSAQDGSARVRCTLGEGARVDEVKAVAAVANMTPPPAPAQPSADDSGDAHRVTTYSAQPARVSVSPEATKQDVGTCLALTATVTDQQGRPVAGANVDVHASGPNDNLQFGSIANSTNAFQPPDKGPHAKENAIRCSDNSAAGQQGDTNRVPGSDEKHIESVSGTTNNGTFTFALRSTQTGGTQISVWADDNDDDVQGVSEAAGGARIGWGQDPPEPAVDVFLTPSSSSAAVGQCLRVTLTARSGGNPLIGTNVDVHVSGAGASFCAVTGGSVVRQPDAGDHTAGAHTDGTQHVEGETDSFGQLVFGVTAASEGEVEVVGWLDESDDDTLGAGEPSATSRPSFALSGDRDISLRSNRNRVRKGRKVKLSGHIDGADACANGHRVKIQARKGGRFRTIVKTRTNDDGDYAKRVRVRKTTKYRAITPRNGVCEKARSRTIRVRAR